MTSVHPGTRLDRADVLLGLFHCWESIDELLTALSDAQWDAATPLPGWRVHDVVAHLIGTESMLLGIKTPAADAGASTLPHVRNPVGALNERWVRHFRDCPPAEMLHRFRGVTDDRRKQLTETTDSEWTSITPTPAGPDTYGRFMRIRTFDCWMHEQDIREAVDVRSSDDVLAGDSSRLALDEIAASMGYIVAKLGGAPDRSRIEVELTGPLHRIIRVAVDGYGRVVDHFDEPPTSTIRLDGVLFTRLVGGRSTASDHAGAIELGGDTAVAQRIVDRWKFVT
jgi:uncharacterized protein (TIGR03083 family)